MFIAVDPEPSPSEAVREGLYPASPHLTLRFLGEVAEDRVETLAATLRGAVRGLSPFDLTLEGVGAFPSRNIPRVVWVGATAGAERVTELAARVSDALAGVGIPRDVHAFAPHVTLFRVRSPGDRRRARLLLDGSAPPPPPRTVHVVEVFLKESQLTREGPLHRTLGAFPLLGPPGADG
jgi:2'-5' RNA ligase